MKINITYDSYDNQTTGNEGLSNGRNVECRNLFGHSMTIQGCPMFNWVYSTTENKPQ